MPGQVIYRVLFARLDCEEYSPIPVSEEVAVEGMDATVGPFIADTAIR